MDQRVMSLRARQWKSIITACNTSGMKKKEWMRIHNVSPKNFYRWQKVLRDEALEEEEFGYPIVPDHVPISSRPKEASPGFVDVTALVSQQTEHDLKQTMPAIPGHIQQSILPEMMIQAGQYQLYIGKDITEGTLATVLRVIGHA